MDYVCAKFGDFSFSRFGFTCGHTELLTYLLTEAYDCYTYATTVGVSKYKIPVYTPSFSADSEVRTDISGISDQTSCKICS